MTNPQPKPGADAGGATNTPPTPAASAPAATPPAPAAPAASGPSAAEIASQAIKAERERVTFINSKAGPGQEKLAAKLIAEGASREQALEELLANATSRLATSFADHGKAEGADAQSHAAQHKTVPSAGGSGKPLTDDEKWAALPANEKAEFFGDPKLFAAYQRGVAKGIIDNPRRESLMAQLGPAEAL